MPAKAPGAARVSLIEAVVRNLVDVMHSPLSRPYVSHNQVPEPFYDVAAQSS